jgi:EAL domain-containing protein (putative c-di-GMP-specific phosphodiesterase class I)
VNISAPSLLEHELTGQVKAALRDAELASSMLTLEITETAVMHADEHASRTLAELRATGVSIAIDDFGAGYSSLRRLSSLPLDELKIDRSFVSAIGTDSRASTIIRLIVDLGRELHLCVTAEGVETHQELEELAAVGCDVVQGFLFAKPMPEDELLGWLDQNVLAPSQTRGPVA